MGDILSKRLGEGELKEAADKVFSELIDVNGDDRLDANEIYTAVLLVFNQINKVMPVHTDPPSRAEVIALLQKHDKDGTGSIDREEFNTFIVDLAKNITIRVHKRIVFVTLVVPAVASLVKRLVCRVPAVGNAVNRVPDSVFAPLVTTAAAVIASRSRPGFSSQPF